MKPQSSPTVLIRDAKIIDVPALTAIKGAGSETVHLDRIGFAQQPYFRYLVIAVDGTVLGFGCLVFRRPASWSDASDLSRLPQIVDLEIHEQARGKGYGSALIAAIERIASAEGAESLYLAVEPLHNPCAFALYRRLGYRQLQPEPYHATWGYADSTGKLHHGEMWVVDMVKDLPSLGRPVKY